MAYLGKNINMALLLLIVGVVVVLIGITIVFQTGLKTRTSDYELASDNLTECSTQLANYKDRLTEEEEKATSAAQDIRRYDQLYETKVDELEDIEGDLANAQNIANLRALTIVSKDKEIDTLGQTINTKNQEISTLNTKIDQLRDDIEILEDDIYACENP